MIITENKEYVKDICDLNNNEILRKILYLFSLFFNILFVILMGSSIWNKNKYILIAGFISLFLGILLIKTSHKVPIQYIYELYDNQIVIIKVFEFNQKIILSTTLTDCQKKLKFNSKKDAMRIYKKNDVFAIGYKSQNQILSFIVTSQNRRYFIQPSTRFFNKLEGDSHDISR